MKNRSIKLLFFAVFFVVISSTLSSVSAVVPSLGVKDGDSFVFVISKYSSDESDSGYFLGSEDDTSYYAYQGDEFTITVANATPYNRGYNDDYVVDYEITINGDTFTDYAWLRGFDGFDFITSTDWDTIITEMKSEIADFNTIVKENENVSGSVSITDTSSEVVFKWKITEKYTDEDGSESWMNNGEIRMERSTGVLLYEHSKASWTETYDGETDSGTEEDVTFNRKGYTPPGEDGSILPGFEFTSILAAFSIMLTPIVLRRKK